MPTLQIRNVPEAVRRRLKAKAALEGISLSDLLLRGGVGRGRDAVGGGATRAPGGPAARDDRPERRRGRARRARRPLIVPGASAAIELLLRAPAAGARCGCSHRASRSTRPT